MRLFGLLLVACMSREGRFVDDGALSMVVPEPKGCSVLENRHSGTLMSASLRSRDGEVARFLRCDSGRFEITAFHIEPVLPASLTARLREDTAEMGGYTQEPSVTEVTMWGRPALREDALIDYAGLPMRRIVVLSRDGSTIRGAAVLGDIRVMEQQEDRVEAWLASVEFAR